MEISRWQDAAENLGIETTSCLCLNALAVYDSGLSTVTVTSVMENVKIGPTGTRALKTT